MRKLGKRDLAFTGPAGAWGAFDGSAISVSLVTTGRPVEIVARVPLSYGGPLGTGVGISFAEDGKDLLPDSHRGLSYAKIALGTVVATELEAKTLRRVPAGRHTWTLRVRHENPHVGDDAQRVYCRTKHVAALEIVAREL